MLSAVGRATARRVGSIVCRSTVPLSQQQAHADVAHLQRWLQGWAAGSVSSGATSGVGDLLLPRHAVAFLSTAARPTSNSNSSNRGGKPQPKAPKAVVAPSDGPGAHRAASDAAHGDHSDEVAAIVAGLWPEPAVPLSGNKGGLIASVTAWRTACGHINKANIAAAVTAVTLASSSNVSADVKLRGISTLMGSILAAEQHGRLPGLALRAWSKIVENLPISESTAILERITQQAESIRHVLQLSALHVECLANVVATVKLSQEETSAAVQGITAVVIAAVTRGMQVDPALYTKRATWRDSLLVRVVTGGVATAWMSQNVGAVATMCAQISGVLPKNLIHPVWTSVGDTILKSFGVDAAVKLLLAAYVEVGIWLPPIFAYDLIVALVQEKKIHMLPRVLRHVPKVFFDPDCDSVMTRLKGAPVAPWWSLLDDSTFDALVSQLALDGEKEVAERVVRAMRFAGLQPSSELVRKLYNSNVSSTHRYAQAAVVRQQTRAGAMIPARKALARLHQIQQKAETAPIHPDPLATPELVLEYADTHVSDERQGRMAPVSDTSNAQLLGDADASGLPFLESPIPFSVDARNIDALLDHITARMTGEEPTHPPTQRQRDAEEQ